MISVKLGGDGYLSADVDATAIALREVLAQGHQGELNQLLGKIEFLCRRSDGVWRKCQCPGSVRKTLRSVYGIKRSNCLQILEGAAEW